MRSFGLSRRLLLRGTGLDAGEVSRERDRYEFFSVLSCLSSLLLRSPARGSLCLLGDADAERSLNAGSFLTPFSLESGSGLLPLSPLRFRVGGVTDFCLSGLCLLVFDLLCPSALFLSGLLLDLLGERLSPSEEESCRCFGEALGDLLLFLSFVFRLLFGLGDRCFFFFDADEDLCLRDLDFFSLWLEVGLLDRPRSFFFFFFLCLVGDGERELSESATKL